MTSLIKAEATTIIKADGLGRRQTSAVRREKLLDEFEHSGLSGLAKFAASTNAHARYLFPHFWLLSPFCGKGVRREWHLVKP